MSRFDDFAETAREVFGLNEGEATDLLESLERDHGFDLDEDTLFDYGGEATDYLDDIIGYEDDLEALDPRFPDDDYLDAGQEWEITADYGEGD